MRSALKVIDAFGETIVWIDEVEKAFAGTRSSGETDAGSEDIASMYMKPGR